MEPKITKYTYDHLARAKGDLNDVIRAIDDRTVLNFLNEIVEKLNFLTEITVEEVYENEKPAIKSITFTRLADRKGYLEGK